MFSAMDNCTQIDLFRDVFSLQWINCTQIYLFRDVLRVGR